MPFDRAPPSSALARLGELLLARGYRFTPPTPATHARVLRNQPRPARDVRDALGWSRPFRRGLDADVEVLLDEAGALEPCADDRGLWRSRLRAATVGDGDRAQLFFHSAFPTAATDAVFFGPDTLRFIALARRWLLGAHGPDAGPRPLGRLVDVGAGSGAGGLSLARFCDRVVLADVNAEAVALAAVNAGVNAADVDVCVSDVLDGVDGDLDVVIANPPYLVDVAGRAYRDGGDRGIAVARRIVREALPRLAPGGRLLLYTGSPVVDGVDLFAAAVVDDVAASGVRCRLRQEELDPDVFGESLDEAAYRDVERIALRGVLVTRT